MSDQQVTKQEISDQQVTKQEISVINHWLPTMQVSSHLIVMPCVEHPCNLFSLKLESQMIRHSMDGIRNAVYHLHPGQTPATAFDQTLFVIYSVQGHF